MNRFPELQPVQACVLRTNPEVNKSKWVGVRTALHQMVNLLELYSELALSPIPPLKMEKNIPTALMQVPWNGLSFFCTTEIRQALILSHYMALPELLDRLLSLVGYHYQSKRE